MGFAMALTAGVSAGWSEISWSVCIVIAIGIIYILKQWTDSSNKYVFGLSVLFIVGFCRATMVSQTEIFLQDSICGKIYKVEEKESVDHLYVKDSEGSRILVVVKKKEPNAPIPVTIQTEFIKLESAMKLMNIVPSGGSAKLEIQDGNVLVGGEVCTMRGKKLYPGDRFTFDGVDYLICIHEPQ